MTKDLEYFKSNVSILIPAKGRNPYYIVVARYTRQSAGIRALHLLCHWLNRVGYPAFLLIYPDFQFKNQTDPYLATPVLTQELIEAHHQAGLTPIVVYPEVVDGNPFNATARVIFLGHYPGKLGGPATYDDSNLLFSYSRSIAETTNQPDNIIYIPVIDTDTFYDRNLARRDRTSYYAGKFKNVFGGVVFGLPDDCIEITRDKPDSQSANEIAELFCRSSFFYCFEDSALVIEALMCNCPVVLMPNEFFSRPIGIDEIGWDGIAWGCDHSEIDRASRTVEKGKYNYLRQISGFFDQLGHFITKSQIHAIRNPQRIPLQVPHLTEAFTNRFLVSDESLTSLGRFILDHSKEGETLNDGEHLLWTHEINTFRAKGLVNLGRGWPNNLGEEVWSSSDESSIDMIWDGTYESMVFRFQSFCGPDQVRDYAFFIDDEELARVSLSPWSHYLFEVRRKDLGLENFPRVVCCTIKHLAVGSPSQLWGGPDSRQIGIRLLSVIGVKTDARSLDDV